MVVHDRARIESEVLPRYFNHASFASLRRQLNYFCFTRIGKGRQRGATYCNEGVVELDDILSLKRRPAGAAAVTSASSKATTKEEEEEVNVEDEDSVAESKEEEEDLITTSVSTTANAVVPFVHLLPPKKRKTRVDHHHPLRKKSRFFKRHESPTAVISPVSSSQNSDDELAPRPKQQVILDLTNPSARGSSKTDYNVWKLNPITSAFESYTETSSHEASFPARDDDIMQGCVALLSFSNEAMRFALT